MSTRTGPILELDSSYARELPELCDPWQAATPSHPRLLALNEPLARELGIEPDELRTDVGIGLLTGTRLPQRATPVAQGYSGHQFGMFNPRLGDGRALLVGELIDVDGERRDLHLKGSGRTRFARGGDGKAAVGPMLREYVIGEAMHALGIPSTRALAVVATGDDVLRETVLPGAVLTRVAASHLRVGTFQYAAMHSDPAVIRQLADYAIERHHPTAREAENPYLEFFDRVVESQASLIARWMLVGFIHGVMNSDNMAISAETIDYGPCAFMEAYDPTTVFSSIDHGGRYAYGNQPLIAQWNLARLAESLLPLFGEDADAAVKEATSVLEFFPARYKTHWLRGMSAKLGLSGELPEDRKLIDDLLELMQTQRVDFTSCFRALSSAALGDPERARALFSAERAAYDAWALRWRERLSTDPRQPAEIAAAMDAVNPIYIPRNHKVEEALTAATAGDMQPFEQLLAVLAEPFTERPGLDEYVRPAPAGHGPYRTFCGT